MRSRARRGDAGSATLQTVLVMPLLLLLITAIVQFALWYHAAHIAIAAAQEGARAARVEGGSSESGRARAQQVLDQLGTRVLSDATITVTRDAETARVEVRATAPELIPGVRLPVHAVSAGKTERFRSSDEVASR
jgi:Flp pilus assembly protein TadG